MTHIEQIYRKVVKERFPLPTDQQVAALEAKIGVRFPPDYRRYLLDYNGGWFGDHSLDVPAEVHNSSLDCLYGIGADHESAELGRPSDMSLFDDNDPPEVVIIGRTTFNYLIVLGVHEETYGQIFIKTYWSQFSKTEQEWFWLADSIEDFFDLIPDVPAAA